MTKATRVAGASTVAPGAVYAKPDAALGRGQPREVDGAAQDGMGFASSTETIAAARGSEVVRELNVDILRAIVCGVADHVEQDTGLSVDVSKVDVKLLPRDEAVELLLQDVERRIGVNLRDPAEAGLALSLRNKLVMAAMKYGIVGALLPSDHSIVFFKESAERSSLDALRAVSHHELTHEAQLQNFPEYFAALTEVSRAVLAARKAYGARSTEHFDALDTVNARTAWLEALPVSNDVKLRDRYPDQIERTDKKGALASILLLFTREGRSKLMQYFKGQIALEALVALGKEDLIQEMYEQPCLVDLLLKSRGSVEVPLMTQMAESELTSLFHEYQALRQEAGSTTSRHGLTVVFIQPDETRHSFTLGRG